MNNSRKSTTWQKVRKFFNDIHLWIGLISGIILFVVCLSGTIYTFSSDIQEMIEPEKYSVVIPGGKEKLSTEAILKQLPDSFRAMRATAVMIPSDPSRSYQITFVKKESKGKDGEKAEKKPREQDGVKEAGEKREKSSARLAAADIPKDSTRKEAAVQGGQRREGGGSGGGRQRGTTYFVNPYTAEVLGTTEGPASGFFMQMFRLHRWLLLDTEIGRPIVGWATVLFSLLVITGWIIWFPQKIKTWKQGLKIKFSANWKRVNHDLHNSLGFYASFLLIIMSLTGLTWSFEWYRTGFMKVLGAYKSPDIKEAPIVSKVPDDSVIVKPTVAEYIATADQVFGYPGNYRLQFAAGEDGTVTISKNKIGFFAPAAADRLVLDQYSKEVLKQEIFRDKKLGERIAGSVKALHVGDVYGTFSKILYFIACLIATSLPITGTLIWFNKLKKNPRKAKPLSSEMISLQ